MAHRRVTPSRGSVLPAEGYPRTPPFAPSWLDRFQAWIESLPIPIWLFYVSAALGLVLITHLLRWADGSLRAGAVEANQLTLAIYPVYFFALIHYLNSAARRALANYRPLLDPKGPDYASLEYTLTRMPMRTGLLAIALGSLISATSYFPAPETWGVQPSFPNLTRGLVYLGAFGVMLGTTYFLFQVIRQARIIDRIHQSTTRLNIYRRDPVYAFSSLTLRSALGLILPVYMYLFLAYSLGLTSAPNAVDMTVMGLGVGLSLAIFFVPLSRMHSRLVAEKHRLLLDADERYSILVGTWNRQVDRGSFPQLDSTTRAIAALSAQREAVSKISTWPWRAETLRSLLSSLAAPIVLYLVSRLIGRFFGV